MRKWRIEDSEELYNINGWGASYFSINEKGNVAVTPKKDGVQIDLKELMDELQLRDVAAPVLLRFPDILDNRIEKIAGCFKIAAEEYNYMTPSAPRWNARRMNIGFTRQEQGTRMIFTLAG